MSKRVKNALIIIVLLAIVLGGGALSLFDVFGYRTWTTEKLTSDFRTMAQQKFGDEATVLIEYNEDAIALLCCNEARDAGYFEVHKKDLISGKWEKSMERGKQRALASTGIMAKTGGRQRVIQPPRTISCKSFRYIFSALAAFFIPSENPLLEKR